MNEGVGYLSNFGGGALAPLEEVGQGGGISSYALPEGENPVLGRLLGAN